MPCVWLPRMNMTGPLNSVTSSRKTPTLITCGLGMWFSICQVA